MRPTGKPMSTHPDLKILMLEDVPEEAEVLQRELRRAGLAFVAQRVQTKADFEDALDEFEPDLILADAKLPKFDGHSALQIVRHRTPRIPGPPAGPAGRHRIRRSKTVADAREILAVIDVRCAG